VASAHSYRLYSIPGRDVRNGSRALSPQWMLTVLGTLGQ
jgi:hypothetical protein